MTGVSEVDDATAVVTEMLQHADAQRHVEAVACAERALRLAREVENPKLRGVLRAYATSTGLTSKAVLFPEDLSLIEKCDRAYELFSTSRIKPAPKTAIIALGVKIQLLLRARRPSEAERVAEDLVSFYAGRPAGKKLAEQSAEVVRIASNMIAMHSPAPAVTLAQAVVDRLATGEASEEQVLAATAQAWIVIAAMAEENRPALGIPSPNNAEELRSILNADSIPGVKEAGTSIGRLIAMGDAALQATESLVPRLKQHGPNWDHPRILLSMVRIATLDDLGRHEQRRAAQRSFADEFGDRDDWRVGEFVQWIQRDEQRLQ
jgi:hypothetical protein